MTVKTMDLETLALRLQLSIASEISKNKKFEDGSFNFWLEKITNISDFNILIDLYQDEEEQETYIEEHMRDWKNKMEEKEN